MLLLESLLSESFPSLGVTVDFTSLGCPWTLLISGLAVRAARILFFFFFYNIVVVFVIHWHESAMDLHVFPIPIPSPTSLSTRSLWVFPVHQARALVPCIQPGLVISFTIDNIHVLMLLSGESHGQRSLTGYSPQGRKELDMTEVT